MIDSMLTEEERRYRIIVAVCSCRTRRAHRDYIRRTWAKKCVEGIECIFFVGIGRDVVDDDVLILDAKDGYPELPSKVHALFREMISHYEFDYLFKCDDDTYVAMERLVNLIRPQADLVGDDCIRENGWPCGGSGYLLSRRAVEELAKLPIPDDGHEDVWVGRSIQDLGMNMIVDKSLQKECHLFPERDNDVVTAHHCAPEVMEVIHDIYYNSENLKGIRLFHAKHIHWIGFIKLMSDGKFLGGYERPHGRWKFEEHEQVLILEWYHWPSSTLRKTESGYESADLTLKDFSQF